VKLIMNLLTGSTGNIKINFNGSNNISNRVVM